MKKLLALLMALMMCCTAFAFAEEEAEVPAVEMNVSFEAQTVALGETGLTMQIPADWAVQEVPAGTENAENILLFAVNADQTVSITAQLSAMSFETLLQGIQDAGATEEMLAELYVNENYCLMYTPGDTVLALYTFLDDETVLAVTFQVASKEVGDALENMPLEIFGSHRFSVSTELYYGIFLLNGTAVLLCGIWLACRTKSRNRKEHRAANGGGRQQAISN